MGKPSVEDELNGIKSAKTWRGELNFGRALQKADIAYLLSLDPEHLERQKIWRKARLAGLLDLSQSEIYRGEHDEWPSRFSITAPRSRHEKLKTLVGLAFFRSRYGGKRRSRAATGSAQY
jgi:hypothetical protein